MKERPKNVGIKRDQIMFDDRGPYSVYDKYCMTKEGYNNVG